MLQNPEQTPVYDRWYLKVTVFEVYAAAWCFFARAFTLDMQWRTFLSAVLVVFDTMDYPLTPSLLVHC